MSIYDLIKINELNILKHGGKKIRYIIAKSHFTATNIVEKGLHNLWSIFIVVAVFLIIILDVGVTVGATVSTAQSVIIFRVEPSITIDAPTSLQIPYESPSGTESMDYVIKVNSNVDWKMSIMSSNGGFMKSDQGSLAKPLKVKFNGKRPGPAIVLTNSYQQYRIGSANMKEVPTTFIQQFSKKDLPGLYSIDLYYEVMPLI